MENQNWFKVVITNATQITVGNDKVSPWYADMIGEVIEVRKTDWDGAYFEAKSGDSILKHDVTIIPVISEDSEAYQTILDKFEEYRVASLESLPEYNSDEEGEGATEFLESYHQRMVYFHRQGKKTGNDVSTLMSNFLRGWVENKSGIIAGVRSEHIDWTTANRLLRKKYNV